jgi:uncharacterized OsmC-like protein
MVSMEIKYVGEKHCELVHGPSGTKMETDAPKDNGGKGEAFSPTDLVGAALGSCILTTVAILAEKEGWTLGKAVASVEKRMTPPPRKIESLTVKLVFSKELSAEKRSKIEQWAHSCPVHRSLHPDVQLPMVFSYE